MKADVLNIKGEVVGSVDLNAEIFEIEPNMPVVHQYVKAYLANQRQGTQSAKTRAEVRGGGRKPWRQKGTGRARVGSSAKASDKELFIIDELKLEAPKTKVVVDMFKNLNINKTLVVIDENDVNVVNSVRNIKDAKCSTVGTLNAYEMLKYNNLVLTKDALNKIEEVYK
mgnify:CR=1 FL=1